MSDPDNECRAESADGFLCTLPPGHLADHVALDTHGNECDRWWDGDRILVAAEWAVQQLTPTAKSWGWGDIVTYGNERDAVNHMDELILNRPRNPILHVYRVVKREVVEHVTIIQSERRAERR